MDSTANKTKLRLSSKRFLNLVHASKQVEKQCDTPTAFSPTSPLYMGSHSELNAHRKYHRTCSKLIVAQSIGWVDSTVSSRREVLKPHTKNGAHRNCTVVLNISIGR
mmetsp:Transcript_105472/g.209609  ORF Transcript_105472/g.209609 Transcript_105472/m.209609 type:complete len:107 (-) Transcript_105472:905-1225(-)